MSEQVFIYPMAIGKQSSPTVAVTPSVYVPCYEESLSTDIGLISDEPAFGSKLKRFQSLQGMRSHTGSFKSMAEPNSAARFIDNTAAKTATSGSNPYTHTFKDSLTADPNFYTYDICKGQYVVRFVGVGLSKLTFGFDDKGKAMFTGDGSALMSVYPREIASVTGSGPYTVTLKTDYDANPTTGFVASDNIRFYDVSAGTYINAAIASIVDGVSFTTSTNPTSIAAGDMVGIAPFTPSFSLLTPFLWGKTQFFFSDTAANALTASSTATNQTRLEQGTELVLMNEFSNDKGEPRSGSFDPAALIRGDGYDMEFKPKVFLDTPDKHREWASIVKRAMVMRSYVGSTNQYELRVTMNNIKSRTNDTPGEAHKPIYHEFDYAADYDSSDTQAFDWKAINAVSSI